MLETMHLKGHTLEYNLSASRVGDLLDDGSNLSGVQGRGRKKNVELGRKQPKRSDIKLTGLRERVRAGKSKYTVQQTNCITERMARWMLTRWSPNTVIRLAELPIGGN